MKRKDKRGILFEISLNVVRMVWFLKGKVLWGATVPEKKISKVASGERRVMLEMGDHAKGLG